MRAWEMRRTKDFITHQTTNLHLKHFFRNWLLSRSSTFFHSVSQFTKVECCVVKMGERERCTLNTVRLTDKYFFTNCLMYNNNGHFWAIKWSPEWFIHSNVLWTRIMFIKMSVLYGLEDLFIFGRVREEKII